MPAAFSPFADLCLALPAVQSRASAARARGHTGVPTAFISLCGFTALLSAAVRKAQDTAPAA